MRLSLRNPAWVIIGLVQPILYLAFFGPLLAKIADSGALGVPAHNPYSFFVPGLLIQLGLFGAARRGYLAQTRPRSIARSISASERATSRPG